MSETVEILTENIDFRGYSSTFGSEYISTGGDFKSKNDALTLPEQIQNKFEETPKKRLLPPKNTPHYTRSPSTTTH